KREKQARKIARSTQWHGSWELPRLFRSPSPRHTAQPGAAKAIVSDLVHSIVKLLGPLLPASFFSLSGRFICVHIRRTAEIVNRAEFDFLGSNTVRKERIVLKTDLDQLFGDFLGGGKIFAIQLKIMHVFSYHGMTYFKVK